MKDEVAGGGRRRVGAPHPPAAPHARARCSSANGAASPPPSPAGSSYSQAGVCGGQQQGRGRLIKRGGMEPGEGRRRGSGWRGGRGEGTQGGREARETQEAAGRRAALSPVPLRCSRGTAASAGPPPRGLPSPSPAAAPLHRAATRIPARLYPPAPGSEKTGTPRAAAGLGKLGARPTLACPPATPPPLPDEPRWPPGFLRAEPSSTWTGRARPPPGRAGEAGGLLLGAAAGRGGAGRGPAAAAGAGPGPGRTLPRVALPPAPSPGNGSPGALPVPGARPGAAHAGLGRSAHPPSLPPRPQKPRGDAARAGRDVYWTGPGGAAGSPVRPSRAWGVKRREPGRRAPVLESTVGLRGWRHGEWNGSVSSSAGEGTQLAAALLPAHSRQRQRQHVSSGSAPAERRPSGGRLSGRILPEHVLPFLGLRQTGSRVWEHAWRGNTPRAHRSAPPGARTALTAPPVLPDLMPGSFGGGGRKPGPSERASCIQ